MILLLTPISLYIYFSASAFPFFVILGGPSVELFKTNNHRVNPIRGDEYGLSALEVESRLRNKLRESFEVRKLRTALYNYCVYVKISFHD